MNTKLNALLHFQRQADRWCRIGIACVTAMIGLMVYVLYLHTQLANCYAAW